MALSKAALALLKALSYPDLEVKQNYEPLRKVIRAASPKPLKPFYRTWDHKVHCGDTLVPVRVFSPLDGLDHPVLLFFHGGGWVTGDIDSYDRICTNMCALTRHVVVSVDYRLAPEHPFPAAPEDCYAVTCEVLQNAAALFHIPPEDVTLIGDSAGGNLAAAVSLMARDRGSFVPRRQILIYPAVYNDHSEHSPFPSVQTNGSGYLLTSKRICDYMDLYAARPEDRQSPYFAPLLAEDLAGQPKTLIITAELDPLRDEGEAYGEKLRAAGVPASIYRIPDALHGFLSLPARFSPVQHAYRIINRFLNDKSGSPASEGEAAGNQED
ncbi:MAG: alpha/beta hydrolase [Provencibacterium sp.]|jgi:acetyl esterase|nr:alpha/beta hydrolase [Provencibacterium sp.]